MSKIKLFLKNEAVLIISFILAIVSCFIVPINKGYLDYIDFKTLVLLFCLMAVMAGINSLGIFKLCAEKMLSRVKNLRALGLSLCLMCFFSSMIITNDVALITFVPFTVVALKLSGNEKSMINIVTVETIAANLGSMLTPIGNPQNLYLYSFFEMNIWEFSKTVLPYAMLSLILLVISCRFLKSNNLNVNSFSNISLEFNKKKLLIYFVLFTISLLTVFRVIPYYVTFVITLLTILIFDKKIFLKIDYSLLLTFLFLFIFIGNLGCIDSIKDYLQKFVVGNEVVAGITLSQVFSNVPAALLLSGFTDNARMLLIGVNLGGLGTLIASMASLISFKFVAKEKVNISKYILVFTALNITFLIASVCLYLILGGSYE